MDKYKASLMNESSLILRRNFSIKLFLLYCKLYSFVIEMQLGDSTKTRITTFTDSMYLYCFNSRQLFFSMRRVTLRQFFSFRYSQNTLWATFVAFLVFSLFFWLSKHAKSLSERSAKRSAIFTRERSEEGEKRGFIYAWAEYYLQPNTVGRHCALADHYL